MTNFVWLPMHKTRKRELGLKVFVDTLIFQGCMPSSSSYNTIGSTREFYELEVAGATRYYC